jgi:hypothetical protein
MRGKPKDGYHCHRSNKTHTQKLVWVLLDSGSDGNLVFVNKDKPMLLPSSKWLVPQSWNTLNGIFQTKRKAGMELNFFEYFNSKRYLVEPDIVEYDENNKPQYDLILDIKTIKEFGIILDFRCSPSCPGKKNKSNNWVTAKIRIKFRPPKFRIYLDRI